MYRGKPEDVVAHGKTVWNRKKSFWGRTGSHFNPYYYSVEPKLAPCLTGYGMLVAMFYHRKSMPSANLQYICNNFTHDLIRILAVKNIVQGDTFCKNLEGKLDQVLTRS